MQRSCRRSSSSSSASDPYAVLGVTRNASKQQISEAYHALALRWHPDRNPDNPDAEERFKEVSAAYQALRRGAGGGPAARDFAESAGMTREEAEKLFKEVFGSDTLSEMAAVFDLAESIQKRAQARIRERFPLAESAMQQLTVNAEGAFVVRTQVRQGGRIEIYDEEVSEEEAQELAKVSLGALRFAGLAARDVTSKVAADIGQNIAQGVFDTIAGGVLSASKAAEPFIPGFAKEVLPDLEKQISDARPGEKAIGGGRK